MAQIPRAALDYLTEEINGISADAKAKVLRVLKELDWNDIPACRDAVVSAVNAVLDAYSLAAGQASADFFDASREIAVGSRLGAAVATGRDPDATEGAIRAFVDKVLKGDIDSFNSAVLSRVGYELKRSAGQTMMENASRDPLRPKYARVPSGSETCRFCLMLASRGFVYHSKKTAGEFGHYHDNCDCQIVASWDKDGVEGYDPKEMYNRWQLSLAGGKHPFRSDKPEGEEFPRIIGEHSIEDDLAATNPRFKEGPEWRFNCQRCVPAYEMRRRGFDVVAKPCKLDESRLGSSGDDQIARSWRDVFKNADWIQCPGTGKRKIDSLMREWGDGARAEVYVAWRGGNAHVFIAENIDGRIQYMCPQTNQSDCSSMFGEVIADKTMVARIDNLEPSDMISECCESRR